MFAKRLTAHLQASSAVVFGVVAACVAAGAPRLALLCGSEAVGQALLAVENLRSLAAGDAEVVYFRGRIGLVAGVVFLVTAVARCTLAAPWLDLPTLATGAVLALFLVPFVTGWRRDLWWGLALVVSALVLGAAFWLSGARAAAASQFAYAAVLVIGVCSAPPWVAEALNVPIFVSLALVVIA